MLIYNKEWIDNLSVRKKVASWLKRNFISADEYVNISTAYQSNYRESNIFARIGMFLFALIIINSAAGVLSLLFMREIAKAFSIECIVLGIASYFFASHFIKEKYYFRSGVTDALIYCSVFSICAGLLILIDGNNFNFNLDPIAYIIIVTPFLIFYTLRFADAFLALLSFACIFILNALLILKLGTAGKIILPFEGMILSFIIYFLARKQKLKNEYRFWDKCIHMIEALSLITLYLSGNYFVVRELSIALMGTEITDGDIPLAFFFYAYTIAVPFLYVWLGLRKKDYTLLRLGLLLEVVGILTIRHYYSVLPPETAMIIAGIFLVVVAWISIKYLKSPKHGITFLATDDDIEESMDNIGAILVSHAVSKTIHADTGTKLGGGSSGAGGAGSDY